MTGLRFFTLLTGLIVTILAGIALLNYSIDPLLQYRNFSGEHLYLNGSQRALHPGALKYRPYSILLLGSSMVQYMRPSMVESVYAKKAFNASLAGSSAYEQAITFDTAVKHKKADHILWGIDLFAFSGPSLRGANNLPDYLYDDAHIDDIRYLLNPDTSKRSLNTLLGPRKSKDLNYDWDWLSAHERKYGLKEVRKAVAQKRFLYNFNQQHYAPDLLRANFEQHFLSRIQQHPEIQFELFFPPYSLIAWAHLRELGWLNGAIDFKRFIIEQLLPLKNVRLYDFQTQLEITTDINNYLDETHFSPPISLQLLQQMAQDKNRLSLDNFTEQLNKMREQASSADAEQLLQK